MIAEPAALKCDKTITERVRVRKRNKDMEVGDWNNGFLI